MKQCKKCGKDIESNEIWAGKEKALWNPIGYFCPDCDVCYDRNLEQYEIFIVHDMQPITPVYIRIGEKGGWKELGYYISRLDIYYDPKSGLARMKSRRNGSKF